MASSAKLCVSDLSRNPKVSALETSLQQSLSNFTDLIAEFQQIITESDNNRVELLTQKEKCKSKTCAGSEELKNIVESKNIVIQSIASALTKLNDTKNLSIIKEIFQIIFNETPTLMSPKEMLDVQPETVPSTTGIVPQSPVKVEFISPKKQMSMSFEDVSFKEESISEIDGTPGRISPIITSKSLKSVSSNSSLGSGSLDVKDKKKCPEDWGTPEAKMVKLSLTNVGSNTVKKKPGGGRLRQARLNLTSVKPLNVIDLTSSPETSGVKKENCLVKLLIKQESSENEDTILPSPTSGLPSCMPSKSILKESLTKFKRPLSLSRVKTEETISPIIQFIDRKAIGVSDVTEMEESFNLVKSNKFTKSPKKRSPAKVKDEVDNDITSMSILQHINDVENIVLNNMTGQSNSPTKRPLAENINAVNMQERQTSQMDAECSMSLLRDPVIDIVNAHKEKTKRSPEKIEPVYKEPTVRKKAEKRALPGWLCEECKVFMKTLYPDDPEKLAKVTARCSKHRGRNNPARPTTPPGFWYPRWDVPRDTEEFNRMNDAA